MFCVCVCCVRARIHYNFKKQKYIIFYIYSIKMEIISGKKKGTYLYIYEGYTYNIDKRNKYIYHCAKRRIIPCNGSLIKVEERYVLKKKHIHPSEPRVIDIFNLKNEMIHMCKNTTATYKEIFNTISRKNSIVAAKISFPSVRSLLLRERIKLRPLLPSSMSDLDNLLQSYDPIKFIYKSYVISEDKYSYIFTSDKLLKILEKSPEIFIDGTFSVSNIYIYIYIYIYNIFRIH